MPAASAPLCTKEAESEALNTKWFCLATLHHSVQVRSLLMSVSSSVKADAVLFCTNRNPADREVSDVLGLVSMCGRYRLTRRRMLEIEQYYEIEDVEDLEVWRREYNIPPREMAPTVLEVHGKRHLVAGLWSLMGPWADSLEQANRASTFNAKAETLTDRPAYRNAFLKRRCIVPAEAFYEWVGPKKERQPLNISRADGKLLSMAGLFNYWKPVASQGRPILTFTVVTTAPNHWMARIHNRMPLILQDHHIDNWLDARISDITETGRAAETAARGLLRLLPDIATNQLSKVRRARICEGDRCGLQPIATE